MHVALLSPAPVRLADVKPNPVSRTQAPAISVAVKGILQHIANSTRLSASDKQGFLQMLADIEKAGNDPKLLMKLMQLISMVEQLHADAEFQKHLLEDITAQYLEIRDHGVPEGPTAAASAVDIVT